MTPFSKTQGALLALISKSFGATPDFDFSSLSPADWVEIDRESRAQTVDLIAFDATKGLAVPDAVALQWLTKSAAIFSKNLKILKAQSNLCQLLSENDIPYVILKGLASSHFYPLPENRICGDVDFLVPAEHFDRADRLLVDTGYAKKDEHNENHEAYVFGGIEFEMHHSVAGIPEGKPGEIFKEYFKDVFNTAVTDPAHGFKKPRDAAHGVVIFLHILHHVLSRGIGLRQICDWACFVAATQNENYWETELLPLFKSAGLLKFCFIVTQVAVDHLGTPAPAWLVRVDSEISENFLKTVFEGGNFGQKQVYVAGNDLMVIKNSEKNSFWARIRLMIGKLNATNHRLYPILDKLPVLYPFIMLWRVIRYLFLALLGKRQSLGKVVSYANKRQSQFEDFELFKTDNT